MPFGGITVLMSGDFRQTLPVIPRAGPAEVISASLKRGATSSSCVFPLTCGFELPETKTPPKTYSGLLITSFALGMVDTRHVLSLDLTTSRFRATCSWM
ncbi:hypothetical protein PI125_g8907 [Phytophthora idaei]|nr:hypothetical protein PI125_g8907 [Phytophthora idaei]